MYAQRVYENYDDYKTLEELYPTDEDFADDVYNYIDEKSNINWLYSTKATIMNFITSLAYPIYNEYVRDRIAYQSDDNFLERIINSLLYKVNKWYMQHKIDIDLIVKSSLDNFIKNGGTHSETNEEAQTGSAVIQKSASTPTGITHNASVESIVMDLSYNEQTDNTTMHVDDNYDDKYTNFIGKTNGVHRNEVGRETDITRSSNYGLAMDILEKIPYSYINEVLSEVSQHFIQIY